MSGSTSSTTGSENVLAICQEINRLGLNLGEEGFPSTERAKLLAFFTKNPNNLDLVSAVLNTISVDNYNERLTYLKELLPEQPGAVDLGSIVKNFDDKLDQLRTVLGDVYELSARSEVSKVQGPHYTSKFEVVDLNGLVRLALPRKLLPSEEPIYSSQAFVLSYRVHKLSNYIYISKMREKLESSINFIRTLPIDDSNYNKNLYDLAEKADDALKKWSSYEKSAKGSTSNNKLYLANTPSLGIMLMTSYVLDAKTAIENGQAPFNTVLDIDFRGRTSGSDITDVTIELGEIKLSSGSKAIKKAYRQLLLRLAVLGFVIKAMNTNGKCNLVGKIFVPRTSEVRIQPSWEDGITFPDSANCHVDIVTIGEKQ